MMESNIHSDVDCDCFSCREFAQGWDCGVRYYDEGRSLDDCPFDDDLRASYFGMGYRQARWAACDPAALIV
jgi:hypothetical protein